MGVFVEDVLVILGVHHDDKRIAEYARRSGARAARVCEIQVTIGGLLPPSWHGGSSAHILVLPNQPKPASQPGCSIQNSCMHDRSERFSGSLLPGRSHQVAACMPCCLALPCTPAIQVVRSVQLSQIRRSVKSIDQSNPSTLATYSRSAFHATAAAALRRGEGPPPPPQRPQCRHCAL